MPTQFVVSVLETPDGPLCAVSTPQGEILCKSPSDLWAQLCGGRHGARQVQVQFVVRERASKEARKWDKEKETARRQALRMLAQI